MKELPISLPLQPNHIPLLCNATSTYGRGTRLSDAELWEIDSTLQEGSWGGGFTVAARASRKH
jgi:hypothetical protein